MTIQVAIAEDQRMMRELLIALLAREPDFVVVGEASTGRQAIDLSESRRPDVLILDIGLPDIDGIEVARALRKSQPQLRIVALSIDESERVVREMLLAGADGYVVKSAAVIELVHAIRATCQGKLYLSPSIARQAFGPLLDRPALARREREVLSLIAEGKRSAEIATMLRISVGTVEVHRRNIMRKLGLHTVAELTKYALREGLTEL